MKTHRSLGSLLASEVIHEPQNKGTKELLEVMKQIGFTDDYVPTYNVLTFGHVVSHLFKDINFDEDLFVEEKKRMVAKDLLWLCNKISSCKIRKRSGFEGMAVKRTHTHSEVFENTLSWIKMGNIYCETRTTIWVNPVTKSAFTFGWREVDYD